MMHSAELPQFVLVSEVLDESEMAQLQQLTQECQPNLLWYGRYNFLRATFEANVNNVHDIIFTHVDEYPSDVVVDKLSNIFLTQVQAFGVDIINQKIALEVYLDRNIVILESAASSGMFWHRDSIVVDGQKQVADYTIILLMNGKVPDWQGADIVLQLGGGYAEEETYNWINSRFPEIIVHPRYNQAIIFKNSNTGHMVTPLIPLTNAPVQRDVLIITCYLQQKV